ncbi:MAG: alpha-amylase [Chitinophagia bacterium]|nr:alpha-amylase [Chitinophagia bacterium]
MKRCLSFFVLLFTFSLAKAQTDLSIYPTHWWAGMKSGSLQLMLHQKDIGQFTRVTTSYPGVSIKKVSCPENRNYLFIDLVIASQARPGMVKLILAGASDSKKQSVVSYQLKARSTTNGKDRIQGVNATDFVYLMMPDRFSNGDVSNDIVRSYRDTGLERGNKFSRHGGDFTGITNHLDYLKELGVTTLWLTPVIENDMRRLHEWGNTVAGYHGYWFTDHYAIDKRYGGNDGYKKFCETLHQNGMKVIQDAVYNHVGSHHFFHLDPPTSDWFNTSQGRSAPNHREEVFFDPYASDADKRQMLDGWFTTDLPDLNQRNPYLATYLIQHAVWSTEEFGIDGWRVDTYKYCEEPFLNAVNVALKREFPAVTVFGESWVNTPTANAYFTAGNIRAPFRHNAEGVLDFQTCFGMLAGISEQPGWTNGVGKLYMTMAQDVLYGNPMNNCIFLDNHDMDRAFSVFDEDVKKLKMALNWLLTLRGIPQLYYGTEVLMKNKKTTTDALVREDFPGGFPGDDPGKNLFTSAGRNAQQQDMFTYVSRLGQFRKSSTALGSGKMMQFIPRDGLYTYFRYDNNQTVMVIANTGNKSVQPEWTRLQERTNGYSRLRNVITQEIVPMRSLQVAPGESFVFELLQ